MSFSNTHKNHELRAVIDIGSNSVRLVIYKIEKKLPITLYNEREICELGKYNKRSGKLTSKATKKTFILLQRFKILLDQVGVNEVYAVATEAVRKAKNYSIFVEYAEKIIDQKIIILSGLEEAQISALGTIRSNINVNGVVADLGGGSLEIIQVENDLSKEAVSLPIGTLQFGEYEPLSKQLDNRIDSEIKDHVNLFNDNEILYAVGGTWRSIARLIIKKSNHPINIVDGFSISANKLEKALVSMVQSIKTNSKMKLSISDHRLNTIPYGAVIMIRLLKQLNIKRVIFSSQGLREGVLIKFSDKRILHGDPLKISIERLMNNSLRGRKYNDSLFDWSYSFLNKVMSDENYIGDRLLRAIFHLSDIAINTNSKFRSLYSIQRLEQAIIYGISHQERVVMSVAIASQYIDQFRKKDLNSKRKLITKDQQYYAILVGELIAFAHSISISSYQSLKKTSIDIKDNKILFTLPKDMMPMGTGNSAYRLKRLSKYTNLPYLIEYY